MARLILRNLARTTAAGLLCLMLLPGATAGSKGKRPPKPPPPQGSFTDHLQHFDTSRWARAHGWTNGPPFDNAWSEDNVIFASNTLILHLEDTAQLGEPYTSGEYRTTGYYGYGCFEASMKPAPNPGAVTSFFTYSGPMDNGGNGRHNEIDVEFAGDPNAVQLNFWTNDDDYTSHNEVLVDLGFDASQAFHTYGFKWTSTGIRWYIDGNPIYEVLDQALNPTPKASDSLQKIMLNLWPVDETAELWAGTFVYPGTPVQATYDWVRYTAGEDCTMQPAPEEPEPPGPVADDALYVLDLQIGLNNRATQAIATVLVRDGGGQAVENARVAGAWSGIITKGDTTRDTDANGAATFYSARSRSPGEVQFCVTDITLAGYTYQPAANAETCAVTIK